MVGMSDANPLPRVGEVFFDDRGEDRALRLSWHPDAEVMVLSLWNSGVCSGTFRLAAGDVPAMLETLAHAIEVVPQRGRRHAGEAPVAVLVPEPAVPSPPSFPMTGEYRTQAPPPFPLPLDYGTESGQAVARPVGYGGSS
jgi:hypothetical protein